jgi:hypothetical protein
MFAAFRTGAGTAVGDGMLDVGELGTAEWVATGLCVGLCVGVGIVSVSVGRLPVGICERLLVGLGELLAGFDCVELLSPLSFAATSIGELGALSGPVVGPDGMLLLPISEG